MRMWISPGMQGIRAFQSKISLEYILSYLYIAFMHAYYKVIYYICAQRRKASFACYKNKYLRIVTKWKRTLAPPPAAPWVPAVGALTLDMEKARTREKVTYA